MKTKIRKIHFAYGGADILMCNQNLKNSPYVSSKEYWKVTCQNCILAFDCQGVQEEFKLKPAFCDTTKKYYLVKTKGTNRPTCPLCGKESW